MHIVLLRVGIDTGCGGIHSPLFKDRSFEFLPIPGRSGKVTYGNTTGRHGRLLSDYFPERKQALAAKQQTHGDPEFKTFTYGDPTPPKRSLQRLQPGDMLCFYAGLKGWECNIEPALYLVGFFEVKFAGFASKFSKNELLDCSANAHVIHKDRRDHLILVKGNKNSRLFKKAYKIGTRVSHGEGYWQKITPEMARIFGKFGGIGSLQRSTPRWVEKERVASAARYLNSRK
ncbi:MAG: hypothetical protein ABI042_03265 [Verrucomicrobiota bacterium]